MTHILQASKHHLSTVIIRMASFWPRRRLDVRKQAVKRSNSLWLVSQEDIKTCRSNNRVIDLALYRQRGHRWQWLPLKALKKKQIHFFSVSCNEISERYLRSCMRSTMFSLPAGLAHSMNTHIRPPY